MIMYTNYKPKMFVLNLLTKSVEFLFIIKFPFVLFVFCSNIYENSFTASEFL